MHPISEVLRDIYNRLLEEGYIAFPLTAEQIASLDSIVKTVNAKYFGTVRFASLEERAAAYFCLLIKDHAVIDGNKRLALIFLQVFCDYNKLTITLPNGITLDVLAVAIEKIKIPLEDVLKLTQEILFFKEMPIIKG